MSSKNPAAVALGRKGGHARAKKLTPQQRSEAARKAVEARWAKNERRIAAALKEIATGTKALLRAQKKRTDAKKATQMTSNSARPS